MSLAKDPEMFEEAAPFLFGASFERKMKEHVESLKCLRQSMAPKSGYRSDQFFKGATPNIRLRVAAATTEEEVDRDFTLTPTEEVEERHRDHSRGRDNKLNRNSLRRVNLCTENIGFSAHFARIKEFYPSVIVGAK